MKHHVAVRFFVALFLALAILPALHVGSASAEQEIIVSAAASLTNAFTEVGKKFEAANPGTKVVLNFAASGALLQQIAQGAPADVFASADQKTMDQAEEKKLILAETRKNFAGNGLVLIVPGDAKTSIKALKDLTLKDITKISVGNPESVPAGRYAEEALTNEGMWEVLKPKFIFANSVRQVLDYVSRGEVDAGIVYATDAVVAKEKVRVMLKVEKHKPILYPIAVVASTGKTDPARRFIDFVLSKEGVEILSKYGFGKP